MHFDTLKWREISRDVDDYFVWRPRCKNVIIETQCNLKKNLSHFSVITMAADALALLDAVTSASKVMTNITVTS